MKSFLLVLISCLIMFGLIGLMFFNCSNKHIEEHIYFATERGEFDYRVYRYKGSSFVDMIDSFQNFKKNNYEYNHLELRRVTRKNYLNICMWCNYKNLPEWNSHPDFNIF